MHGRLQTHAYSHLKTTHGASWFHLAAMFRRRCYADEQDHCCQPGYYWFCVIDIVTLNSLAQYRACVRQIEADKNDGCVYLRGCSTASAARPSANSLVSVCLVFMHQLIAHGWIAATRALCQITSDCCSACSTHLRHCNAIEFDVWISIPANYSLYLLVCG